MPTPPNPVLSIAGPAFCVFKNKVFRSKGNIPILPKLEESNIELVDLGVIETRELNLTLEAKFTPVGTLDALSVVWPYGIITPGDFIHASTDIVSVDTATDIVTFKSLARFRDGAPILPASFGTLPTGIAAQLYYLHILSGTTGTLHPTEADALAGTNTVDITADGTGKSRIIEQEYLKVIDADGVQYLFHNAAVSACPDLNGSSSSTAIGEVTFEFFRKFATAPTSASAFYTRSTGVAQDATFDPEDIITQAFSLAWGAVAPWAAIGTRDGVKATFPLTLEPVGDDVGGIATRKITSAEAQFTCKPIAISEEDVYAKLDLQGASAGRGRRIVGTDDLLLSGTDIYAQLYSAVLVPPTINYDRKTDRVSEVSWKPTRTFTAGVPNPLYYVGSTAP